ncbi:hypothetical protein [Bartonella sp. DGB1]|uniref:hypothetical protein n=1 Tax=Bartonella sp. DGB1 TaxID=3239807 RepID=UPI0035267BAD
MINIEEIKQFLASKGLYLHDIKIHAGGDNTVTASIRIANHNSIEAGYIWLDERLPMRASVENYVVDDKSPTTRYFKICDED